MKKKLDLESKKGILLDIACGNNKQVGFIGLDKTKWDNVDIVHDLEVFPWPLEDNSCLIVIGSHIVEHIKPWLTIDFFNECWRILKPNGQLIISTPYGGSVGYWQDPTHCNGFTERTFWYFDPAYELYNIYKPKPWKIEKGFPSYQMNGNLEILMRKAEVKEEV